jgi:uracil phosphoribosyltransferase
VKADTRAPCIVDHPLVGDALSRLRDARTDLAGFRLALAAAAAGIAHEITRDLPRASASRETPLGPAHVTTVDSTRALVVVILRAGLGMLPATLALLPGAAVGLVGVEREPGTWRAREYYRKLPPDPGGPVFVLDPMVATGGSALHVLDLLAARGVEDARIRFGAVVVAPEGLERLRSAHPGVRVFAAALDEGLNDAAEIVPGIGDAGDRLFGTA